MTLKGFLLLGIFSVTCLALGDVCKKDGVFPHSTDCTKFYTCHGSTKFGFEKQEHRCPSGMMFSKYDYQCVDLTEDPECEQEVLRQYDPYVSDPACDGQAVHCANCTHLVYCQLVGEEFQNPNYEDCAVSTMNAAPYCDANQRTCTSLLPEGCKVPGFVCTSPGFFPDTKGCNVYHICYDAVEYESYRCASLQKPLYNSQEFRCSNESQCQEQSACGGTIGLVAYPNDPRYYLLCMSAGRSEIYSCKGNTEFIDGAQGCQFVCNEEGLFPDVEDCFSYYRCESNMGIFNKVNETCPTGLAFNPIARACDAVDNVKC
ncbi:uncharacterized protein LOC132193456 [Neocloeon triangulifer]|uniref:uncharacterized protein LOC132193456 n=1 Tax=Neocloeon triangulifer TaxID=2078957 RepID=UPI00286EF7A4|nr:uncharacterized protein LOC132193456 [Neocloeon triangulifer]